MTHSHDLTTGPLALHYRKLAVPVAIGMVFSTLYNVVDVFFAGPKMFEERTGQPVKKVVILIAVETTTLKATHTLWKMARSEALVAFTNPKLILIFYAFFPQFIDPEAAVVPQVAVMGGTFILIEVTAIALYAFGGTWLQARLENTESSKWLSRFTATALTAAAGLILLP